MSGNTDILMSRFSHALGSPIHNRCAELTVLIDRCSSKDLQNLFPTLMESIFGTSGGMSWGLRNITSASHPQDFETLHHFLGPLGPIFRLIYKLLTDCQVKYEFSFAHMPGKVRYILEHSKVPPFYADLLNVDPQTRKVHSLSLNAFDFYMFHFAYHLTNPWQQRSMNSWSTWNCGTVYYILGCDYMIHFLPTDPNTVVLPQLTHFTGKNPVIIPPQSVTNRPQRNSKLLRTHVLQQASTDISSLHQPMQQHPRGEIWRSETVVQVFVDIWLNNDQLSNVDTSFIPQSKVNDLPSGEYIRILRILVKQLHAFSANAKSDTTPLGELKKIVQPMLQGKMYAFLRHLVYRWPLDGSFRLVLELWLSFIQPWRYLSDNSAKIKNQDIDELGLKPIASNTRAVDKKYLGFIAENLLAYTVIFQQLLTRFSRIDLASPKNSLMLYRVTKVFGQPNLVQMIQEIESCVENLNNSPTHSYNTTMLTLLPPLSPTSCWSTNTSLNSPGMNITNNHTADYTISPNNTKNTSYSFNQTNYESPSRVNALNNKWAAIVRHRIYEWEGPEFCYKPMFVRSAAPEVYQLLRCTQVAEKVAIENIRIRMEEARLSNKGFSAFLKSLLYIEENTDEFSLDERKKVTCYLSFARQNLIEIFQLDMSNMERMQTSFTDSFYGTMDRSTSTNSSLASVDMSPTSFRLRAKNIKYEGDPDLHPIRSSENGFLVKILYLIAQKINSNYSGQFHRIYHRKDFIGKLMHQILCPALLTYSYDKTVPGLSPRVQKLLPPRISLRYFASHRFLAYMLIGLILSKFLGYGVIMYIFIIFLFWIVFIFFKTLFGIDNINYCNDTYNDASF